MMLDILKNLQKEISTFLITIALATILIVISQSWWQTSYDDKSLAQMDLNAAKDRYYTAINQKKLLEKFEESYNKLKTTGIVGEEERLNWVDTIENITANNKIPYLKYKIDKRQPINSGQLTQKFPGIELYKSPMSLEMQLLHEGDLYTIINNLHDKAKGLFDIRSCAIIRNTTSVESLVDSQTDRNFSAKCELNWYTMQKKSVQLPSRRNI
ncbi:MAG: hypothetical protein DIZ80_10200 [endosymbiont of Galathealinum brachiosum]|uniref:Uncharacterized protein n=1 Tax=endosymbiont of Galathealinum brachiosum TaxID=2200906 RepID=A0A370DCP2_9GAMM|nr:MAG: hypothetical protein DIZ80_10200 [endosymbiont of Galathealinum brachiosum]